MVTDNGCALVAVACLQMYQMLTGKLPFWSNKTIQEISKLMPWEVMAAVRTHEVRAGVQAETTAPCVHKTPHTTIKATGPSCHAQLSCSEGLDMEACWYFVCVLCLSI
jgi:hypothetical protein